MSAATAGSQFNSQNQLTVDNAAFDSSGNQTGIGAASGSYAYTWDAEGRITSAASSASVTAYVYDGEGQRVQKITCPPGTQSCTASTTGATVTSYVYDAAGNLAAEYGALEDGRTSDCGTAYCYVSVDHLGSTRLLTDANGNVQRRYDYLPFGEEAWAGSQWGGRTSGMGYQATADGFNPKFTGQQRDTESLLDYFHARYYAPYQGRFVSPDPGNAGADMTNPQTWNGYSYTGNNPLNITDPSGLGFWSSFGNFLEGLIGDVLDVASGGIWAVIQAAVNGTAPPSGIDLFGPPGLSNLGGCGGPLGTCGTLGADPWSELSGLDTVEDPGRFIFDQTSNSGGGKSLLAQTKDRVCSLVPDGSTVGISGSAGALMGPTGGVELVNNYNTGESSLFFFGGAYLGYNGLLAGNLTLGYIRNMKQNSDYSGPFSSASGSVGPLGAFVSATSQGMGAPLKIDTKGAQAAGISTGLNVSPVPVTAAGSLTFYTKPIQLRPFSGFKMSDYLLFIAKQLCHL